MVVRGSAVNMSMISWPPVELMGEYRPMKKAWEDMTDPASADVRR